MAASALPESHRTAAQAIGWACEVLAGRPAARLEAERLLAQVMGIGRATLLSRLREPLGGTVDETFTRLVARRVEGEPLAYLIGSVEFYGLELEVTPATFVPRPETELLVDWAIDRLRQRAGAEAVRVVDVGTGCGAIAVALAKETRSATLIATDVSAEALAVAAANVRRHGLEDRVRLVQADLLPAAPRQFELVVANLPYVAENDPDLDPAVARFEPAWALYGGRDGLDVVRRLLEVLPGRLAPGADLGLEIGWRQGAAALALAEANLPGGQARCWPDLAGCDRLITVEAIGCLV